MITVTLQYYCLKCQTHNFVRLMSAKMLIFPIDNDTVIIMLLVHKDLTETIDHTAIINEFTSTNIDKHKQFGRFH